MPTRQPDARTAARRALAADLKNIEKRVRSGKPLTQAQRHLLEAEAGGVDHDETPVESQQFARNQSELAALLGCTRQRLNHWLHRQGAPQAREDGRHDVSAWRSFLAAHGRLPVQQGEAGESSEAISPEVLRNQFHSLGEALPKAVGVALRAAGVTVRPKQHAELVFTLWMVLAEVVELNSVEYGLAGPLSDEEAECPDEIARLAALVALPSRVLPS